MAPKKSKKVARPPRYRPPVYLRVPSPDPARHPGPRQLDAAQAARLTGYSTRSVSRWQVDGIPAGACLTTLQAAVYGVLPHPDWQDWYIAADGALNHWSGRRALSGFTPGMLHNVENAYRHQRDTAREKEGLQAENTALRLLVDTLRAAIEQQRREDRAPSTAANDDYGHPQQLLAL